MRYVMMAVTPLLGIGIVLVGIVFSIIFVGIPYPDASPADQARYNANMDIGQWIVLSGCGVFLIGLILIPVIFLLTRKEIAEN